MPIASIEHVNITVGDADRTTQLLIALFGWHIRWQGTNVSGGYTVHVGSETDYIVAHTPKEHDGSLFTHRKGDPLNHIGIEVDDLDAVEARAIALGLTPFGHDDYDPGRRFYLMDPDGIELEIVSYAE